MNGIMGHKAILYVFLVSTALFGWLIADYEASLIKKYDPLMLILIDALVTIAILAIGLPLYYKGDLQAIGKELSQLNFKEVLSFLGLGIIGIATGILAIRLLAHHGVAFYKSTNHMMDLFAGIIGIFIFTRKELSSTKKLAVVLMGVAAYIFM